MADLLAPLDDLSAEHLRTEAEGIVPGALYDVEWAVRFLVDHLNGMASTGG
ncbi:hypothetical protein ABZ608_27430 [Streptomyces sp. NPDC013172]|uniref:hypothetical protein n=1 Tax=Streptomyces sp. NPDC013172 TaxID=3155009 RepID=UPI0033F29040